MLADARRRLSAQSAFRLGQWISFLFGAPLILIVGVALLVGGLVDDLPQMVVFGAFLTCMGALAAVVLPLEFRLVFRRPGAALGTGPDGRAALVVSRARWHMPATVATLAVIAGAPLASGVLALLDSDQLAWAVVMLPLGLWLASYLVPILRGQVRGGGLYLTPEHITYVKHGGWWRVNWGDLGGPVPGEPMMIVLAPGRTPEHGRTTHWGWKGAVRTPEDNIVGVETRHLALDPTTLTYVVASCAAHPEWRSKLGTAEAVTWANAELQGRERSGTSR